MTLTGSVKIKARPDAKMSAHHGIWTWSFITMHSTRESKKDSTSVRWNHQPGMSSYLFINLV